jgi:photosystem II stability/assembly factor-like uncharacterized protein
MPRFPIIFTTILFLAPVPSIKAARWQAIGPFGGSVAIVQVDPHRTDTVLAATSNALLFRSSDGGYSWNPIPSPAALQGALHAFVIDPKTPNVYYAGLSSDSPAYRGIFRSRDAGATWQPLAGVKGKDIWSIAIWPADARVLAAGARDGVMLSRDGGESWTRISPAENRELQPVVSLAFDPVNSKILYAGTPHLPWKTVNGGTSWRSIHDGMADDSDVFSIEVDPKRPPRVFASACSGIYLSVNGGSTWRKLHGAKGASYRTYFVAQDPRHAGVVYAGTNHGLEKSADGGATWRQLSTNPTRSVAFDRWHAWRTFVATDGAGILRSNDSGKTWNSANQGFCNRYLSGLIADGAAVYTATAGSLHVSSGASPWRAITPAPALVGERVVAIAAAPGPPERLYVAGDRGLLASSDGGRKWAALRGADTNARLTALLAMPRYILAGSESGLLRRSGEDKAWERISLPGARPAVRSLVRLGAACAAITGSGAFLSRDGVTWKKAGVVPGKAEVLRLAAGAQGTLFAATSQGAMRSEDFGASWRAVGSVLDGNTVSAICTHPAQPDVVFAAQYGMIYVSSDNGHSWKRMTSGGLVTSSIEELAVLPGKPGHLFALASSQGVFELALEAQASVFSTAP